MFGRLIISLLAVNLIFATPAYSQAYEHKYGDGRYNYDVNGYDDNGNYVSGNLDTDGKEVEGYITDEDGNDVYFDGEFVGNGEIEGYDENGNFVELEVE